MIGEKLGPYQIDAKLGQGAMGVVYRGINQATDERVAIKVFHLENAKGNTSERFLRESDILKQFRHPNIVRLMGSGRSASRNISFYAMEYVPGKTLEEVVRDRGALPWTEVVELGIQMCEALQYAHERGVVHRDLKPSNLMITEQGQLKLTDFGIAKDLDRTALTATGRTLGTAAYMAPEQIRGTPEVSHKTDLYALGCVLYEMVTGRMPFEGGSTMVLMHKHLDQPPPRPSAVNPEIPLALDKLIVKLMAKNRDDRPWDATAACQTLVELREKRTKGEPIRMVFGPSPAEPPRAGSSTLSSLTTESTTAGAPAASPTRARKKRKAKKTEGGRETSIPRVRFLLETGGMLLLLVLLCGVVGYQFWPPSAAYLHRKAVEGMASTERVDWRRTMDQYVAELERRFPDHPYKEEVAGWKDRLLLEDAKSRADFLEGVGPGARPRDEAETVYRDVFLGTADELKNGRDLTAFVHWNELAEKLARRPEDRKWYLLVRKRADDLGGVIKARLETVKSRLIEADVAERTGNDAKALNLRRSVLEHDSMYESLSELLGPLRAIAAPPADPGAPSEAPAPPPEP